MKNVKFISKGKSVIECLNYSYNAVTAVRNEEEILCLVGDNHPYMPAGGRKVLKEILATTEEGKTYFWKKIN